MEPLFMNKKECQQWLKMVNDDDQSLIRAWRLQVVAPYLYGADFLPPKWRVWMDNADLKSYIEKWLEVEPIDVNDYEKLDLIKDVLSLLASQIITNGVDFQRLMNLAIQMDKQETFVQARDLAADEVSFKRLWLRHCPATEQSKAALMMVVLSYIQFACETIKKKKYLNEEMTKLTQEDKEAVESYKNKGNIEHKAGHYSKAVTQYGKAIRKSRYDEILYSNRSMAFLNMKKLKHALLDAKRAITINPTWAKGYHRFAQAMFELGYQKHAMESNASAIDFCKKCNPEDPYLRALEMQRDLFRDRQATGMRLHDIPDLVDPSSSDSEDSDCVDLDKTPRKVQRQKLRPLEEKAKPRKAPPAPLDNNTAGLSKAKTLQSKDRRKEKEAEEERKRINKERDEAERLARKQKVEKEEEDARGKERVREQERKRREAELRRQEEQIKATERKGDLDRLLHLGSEAILEQRGRHAFMYYKQAMDYVSKSSLQYGGLCEEDYVTFLYAYGMACLESGIEEEILDASNKFETILEDHSQIRSPLPYYGLCYALFRQNKFSEVFEPLKKARHMAEWFLMVETWPGTKRKIKETEKGQMKIALAKLEETCRNPPHPDAVCRLDSCPYKPEMYLTDVGFRGYVKVQCRERCHMDYHIACWKRIKVEEYPDVTHERELLTKRCRTPDCDGIYISVTIYGPDGLPKTEQQLEEAVKTKEKKNKGVIKLQAKKSRKSRKPDPVKKQKHQERGPADEENEKEDQDSKESKKSKDKRSEEDQGPVRGLELPSSATGDTSSAVSFNTRDADEDNEADQEEEEDEGDEDVQLEAQYVLKKDDLEDEPINKPAKSKYRKKKGKDKTSMPIEFTFSDAAERKRFSSENAEAANWKPGGVYSALDPINPFATPAHLREAAGDFERDFRPTQLAGSQSEEEKSQITALHMHFEDFLQRVGPVLITDTRLGDQLQQMPSDLQAVVHRYGGLGEFLLNSSVFYMLGDYVHLLRDTAGWQEMARQNEALRAGYLPAASHPRTRNYPGGWSNAGVSLKREDFPSITEVHAEDAAQPQRGSKKQEGAATVPVPATEPEEPKKYNMTELERIYADNPEKQKRRTLETLKDFQQGFFLRAKDLDIGDRKAVQQAFVKNPEEERLDDEIHERKCEEKRIEQERLRNHEQTLLEMRKNILDDQEYEERKRKLEERFAEDTPKKASMIEPKGIQTLIPTKEGILNSLFAPERSIEETLEHHNGVAHLVNSLPITKTSSISMTNANKITTDKTSDESRASLATVYRVDAEPFIPASVRNAITIDSATKEGTLPCITPECRNDDLEPPKELQSQPVGQTGLSSFPEIIFDSSSTSGESSVSIPRSEQSTENWDSSHVSGVLVAQGENNSQPTVSTQNLNEDFNPDLDVESVLETSMDSDSQPDEGTCVDTATPSTNKPDPPIEPLHEPSDSNKPLDIRDSTPDPTADTDTAASATSNNTNGEAGAPPSNAAQNSASSVVSAEKYNDLLKKFTQLYNALKCYTDRKKAMKCSWTQCPKVGFKSQGIMTGPDKILAESQNNEFRLQMNFNDISEEHARLKDRYDTETLRLREETKRLRQTLAKYETERTSLHHQVLSAKKSQEAEVTHLKEELQEKDSQLSSLDSKMASLTKQMASKDEFLESTLQKMTSERDLWTAEKMKLEEAASSQEKAQQLMLKRCQDAEISILRLRCDKDVAPLEGIIRDCQFRISSCQNVMERNPNIADTFREYGAAWEKCLSENRALLAAHKAKYEDLAHQVKAGFSLNQLEPPKPVRPAKAPPPLQVPQWGPPGVGVPFGARMVGPRMGGTGLPTGVPGQPMQVPSQMLPPKSVAAAGLPSRQLQQQHQHQQRLEPPRLGINALEEIRVLVPEQKASPPLVSVSMAGPTQPPGYPGAPSRPVEGAPQPGTAAPGQTWPVSLAHMQSSQESPITVSARMAGYSMPPGGRFQPPRGVTQPLRQPLSSAVTSSAFVGSQHMSSLASQGPPRPKAPSPPVAQGVGAEPATQSVPAPGPQPRSNFEKIIFPLHNMFPEYNKVQLTKVIKEVRAANHGSLSGLSIEEIIQRATDLILAQQRNATRVQRMQQQQQAGRSGAAVSQLSAVAGPPRASSLHHWEPAKTQTISAWGTTLAEDGSGGGGGDEEEEEEEEEDPCVICHEEMLMDTVTLHCGHKFHPPCIKMWLQEQRTCPTCRNYTLLPDEYPAPK